jgi:hypothetical protein
MADRELLVDDLEDALLIFGKDGSLSLAVPPDHEDTGDEVPRHVWLAATLFHWLIDKPEAASGLLMAHHAEMEAQLGEEPTN